MSSHSEKYWLEKSISEEPNEDEMHEEDANEEKEPHQPNDMPDDADQIFHPLFDQSVINNKFLRLANSKDVACQYSSVK